MVTITIFMLCLLDDKLTLAQVLIRAVASYTPYK